MLKLAAARVAALASLAYLVIMPSWAGPALSPDQQHVVTAPGPARSAAPNATSPCQLKRQQTVLITTQLSNSVLATQSGERIRLADVYLLPSATPHLATLVGRTVGMTLLSDQPDRHGVKSAFLFAARQDGTISTQTVQSHLTALGLAVADPDNGPRNVSGNVPANVPNNATDSRLLVQRDARRDCLDKLVHLTIASNRHQLSWDTPPKHETLKYAHHRGEIKRVSQRGKRLYLNFGRNWRKDATVTISNELLAQWPAWAKRVQAAEGRHVNVLGWWRWRNGPLLKIDHPAQIVFIQPPQKPTRAASP
ncbi:MAG: hypothetical protein AAGG72_09050 [Pseudomonadota bacterium]